MKQMWGLANVALFVLVRLCLVGRPFSAENMTKNKHCMLCFSSYGRILNIHEVYYKEAHPVKDDLVEFLGNHVSQFLQDDDSLCLTCKNVVGNVAEIKRLVTPLVCRTHRDDRDDHKKTLDFGDLWEKVGKAKYEATPDTENVMLRITPSYCTPTSSSSPENILFVRHALPYDPYVEELIEERERKRSLSRASISSSNIEVADIMKKSDKRRKSTSHRPHTVATDEKPRSNSRRQSRSRRGRPRKSDFESVINLRTLIICNEVGCNEIFYNIDQFTMHKKFIHNDMLLYTCDQCNFRYSKREHLEDHKTECHDQYHYNCFMCGTEVFTTTNLQVHIRNHLRFSVPCDYCDKSFLSEQTCSAHVRSCHRNRQREPKSKIFIKYKIEKDGFEEKVVEEPTGRISPPMIRMIQVGKKNCELYLERSRSEETEMRPILESMENNY